MMPPFARCRLNEQDAAILVLGDIISIKLGDIVPTNAELREGDPLKIDQSALTRESLSITKKSWRSVLCLNLQVERDRGSTPCLGRQPIWWTTQTKLATSKRSLITAIGNFCICSIAIGMIIEIIVMYPIQHRRYRDGIDNYWSS